ncbi:MAG: cation diffusion facilitator family transporter [Candidatus Asgardarchaeia archaeon]
MSSLFLRKLLGISIFFYILSSILKILGGIFAGSSALLADGLDSTINILSSSFAYISFRLSSKPPDEQHPYGHYGFEVLSVIFTSIIMFIIGTIILTLAILRSSSVYNVGDIGIFYSFLSTLVILFAFVTISFGAKKTSSVSLKAESRHLGVDLLESLSVLVSLFFATYYTYLFDIVMAIGIGTLMYIGAARNIFEVYQSIVYEIPSKELLTKIKSIVYRFPDVLECHNLRVRRLGTFLFVDMHILVKKDTSIYDAHEIAELIEKEIKKELPSVKDIVIHLEPFETEG